VSPKIPGKLLQTVLGLLCPVPQGLAAGIKGCVCKFVLQLLVVMAKLLFQPLRRILGLVLGIPNCVFHVVFMPLVDMLRHVCRSLRPHCSPAMILPGLRGSLSFGLECLHMLMGFAPSILESGLHSVLLFLCIMLHMPGSFFDSVGQFCSMRCIEVKGTFARLIVESLELFGF